VWPKIEWNLKRQGYNQDRLGDIEKVIVLRGSLSNSYPEDKSSQKTALNQLNASAVLAMLCQGSHREEHRVFKMILRKTNHVTIRFPCKGTWNKDTSVVNELAVKNAESE